MDWRSLTSTAIVASCIFSLLQASLFKSTSDRELEIYRLRNKFLIDMLISEECMEDRQIRERRDILINSKYQTLLEVEQKVNHHLINELIECREGKGNKFELSTKPTTSAPVTMLTSTITTTLNPATTENPNTMQETSTTMTPTTLPTTTTKSTTTNPPPVTSTTAKPPCKHQHGYSKMAMDFISFRNPSNRKATGSQCDRDGSFCDIYMEFCISPIDSLDCSLFNMTTAVIESSTYIAFTSDLGGYPNPLVVDFGLREWQGVNVLLSIWDKDSNSSTDDVVDEFSFNYTDQSGAGAKIINIESTRSSPKSWLKLQLRNYCPALIKIATLAPAAIFEHQPAECQSAKNLTGYWRKDYFGSDIKPNKGSWNNDLTDMVSAGRPWFRFTGAAGNRLLDYCVDSSKSGSKYSCGTGIVLWSDEKMPTVVGSMISFNAFGSWNGDCKDETYRCSAMRCSNQPHDLIYRYDDSSKISNRGFCGMD